MELDHLIYPSAEHQPIGTTKPHSQTSEFHHQKVKDKPFNSAQAQIVFQELPEHISLAYTIYGCPLACEGCHSEDTWDKRQGHALSDQSFTEDLITYQGLINAVVFFGGEWHPLALQAKLKIAQAHGLKTCLYTGLDSVSRLLKPHLDFVKTGRWIPELGGLDATTTNQKFLKLEHGEVVEDLTHCFRKSSNNINSTPYLTNTHQGVTHASA